MNNLTARLQQASGAARAHSESNTLRREQRAVTLRGRPVPTPALQKQPFTFFMFRKTSTQMKGCF